MSKPKRYKPVIGYKSSSSKRIITIYVSEDAMLTLNAVAKQRDRAVSGLVGEIVEAAMKDDTWRTSNEEKKLSSMSTSTVPKLRHE